jgi:hypothetical protein
MRDTRGLGLDAWWDEPAYQASGETFSERGAFILAKLEAHDAAKLKDVLADVYRDDLRDPADMTKFEWGDHPALHGRAPRRDQGRAAPDGAGMAVIAASAAGTHDGRIT